MTGVARAAPIVAMQLPHFLAVTYMVYADDFSW